MPLPFTLCYCYVMFDGTWTDKETLELIDEYIEVSGGGPVLIKLEGKIYVVDREHKTKEEIDRRSHLDRRRSNREKAERRSEVDRRQGEDRRQEQDRRQESDRRHGPPESG